MNKAINEWRDLLISTAQSLCMCHGLLLFIARMIDTDVDSGAPNKLPFAVDIPGSCGYVMRMIDGVMRVYASQASLDNDVPVNYTYPDLMQFLTDQNLLFCLIADGPL